MYLLETILKYKNEIDTRLIETTGRKIMFKSYLIAVSWPQQGIFLMHLAVFTSHTLQ